MYGCVESKILYTNGPAKYEMPLLRRMCATISWAVHLPDVGKCKLLHVCRCHWLARTYKKYNLVKMKILTSFVAVAQMLIQWIAYGIDSSMLLTVLSLTCAGLIEVPALSYIVSVLLWASICWHNLWNWENMSLVTSPHAKEILPKGKFAPLPARSKSLNLRQKHGSVALFLQAFLLFVGIY